MTLPLRSCPLAPDSFWLLTLPSPPLAIKSKKQLNFQSQSVLSSQRLSKLAYIFFAFVLGRYGTPFPRFFYPTKKMSLITIFLPFSSTALSHPPAISPTTPQQNFSSCKNRYGSCAGYRIIKLLSRHFFTCPGLDDRFNSGGDKCVDSTFSYV